MHTSEYSHEVFHTRLFYGPAGCTVIAFKGLLKSPFLGFSASLCFTKLKHLALSWCRQLITSPRGTHLPGSRNFVKLFILYWSSMFGQNTSRDSPQPDSIYSVTPPLEVLTRVLGEFFSRLFTPGKSIGFSNYPDLKFPPNYVKGLCFYLLRCNKCHCCGLLHKFSAR